MITYLTSLFCIICAGIYTAETFAPGSISIHFFG